MVAQMSSNKPELKLIEPTESPEPTHQELIEALALVNQAWLDEMVKNTDMECLKAHIEQTVYDAIFNMNPVQLTSLIDEVKEFRNKQWQPFIIPESRRCNKVDSRETPFHREFWAWLNSLSETDQILFDEITGTLLEMPLEQLEIFNSISKEPETLAQFEAEHRIMIPEHLRKWFISYAHSAMRWRTDDEQRLEKARLFVATLTEDERDDLEQVLWNKSYKNK